MRNSRIFDFAYMSNKEDEKKNKAPIYYKKMKL